MAKRQTVWLSAMMILSLMVIGYYTVDDTLKPVPTTTKESGKKQEQTKENNSKEQGKTTDKKQTMTGGDWFAEQFIQKETSYSKKVEQLQQVIADSKTSTDQKVKAEQDLKALTEFYEKAEKAEDKVMAEGYEEALVTKDNDRVTVTVQTKELSKEQVAKIYSIVGQELNVPANQIVVSYKQ